MTTSTPRTRPAAGDAVTNQRIPSQIVTETVTDLNRAPSASTHRWVDILRLALGFIFIWAFLDKLFGLGFSTPGARSWINGGSPTNGFLSHVSVGPLQSMFRSIAGNGFVDWLFMLALLGIGVGLLTGVMLRFTAIAGTLLMVLMWAAEWPLARFNSAGDPTGSTNPFMDYHLVYAIGMIVVAVLGVASTWGLGHWWSQRKVVAENPSLL
jgi:thiosulfate dehydrogenase [quinone] large subunit